MATEMIDNTLKPGLAKLEEHLKSIGTGYLGSKV